MNLIMLGPPGAGKGTQAKKLSCDFHIPQISTGDIFREAIHNATSLGKQAQKYMDKGKLVPDHLAVEIVAQRIQASDCLTGFILDGFPRTTLQADELDHLLTSLNHQIDHVLCITVDNDILIKRLAGRMTCRKCTISYHLIFHPPQQAGICDQCGSELFQREDDKENAIRTRLKNYTLQTQPLIQYYQQHGILREIEGLGTIDEVYLRISKIL